MDPPLCPKCNLELEEVIAEGKTTWLFQEELYDAMKSDDQVKFICPYCGEKLDELFKNGIYYYGISD